MLAFIDKNNIVAVIGSSYIQEGNFLNIDNQLYRNDFINIIEFNPELINISIQKYKYENEMFVLNDKYEEYDNSYTAYKNYILSKAQFMRRLTFEEQNALRNFSITIPLITTENVQEKIMAMNTLWGNYSDFKEVDLGDTSWVMDFVQIVVWTGLISMERAIEITTV